MKYINISFVFILMIFIVLEGEMKKPILELLPSQKELLGWKVTESKVLTTVQEMSDYMNGGAELYFAYDFTQLGLKRFVSKEGLEMIVELYKMRDKDCAYGVLSFDLSGKRIDIGTIGMYDLGLLKFWKGNYFCRIQMWEGYEKYENVIFRIGKIIEKNISPTEDKIPELVNLLPEEGLQENSIHYFFHPNPLNNFYYISNENLFNLGEDARGVIAHYNTKENGKFYLMIVEYKDNENVYEVYKKFMAYYLNEKKVDKKTLKNYGLIKKIKNEYYTGIDIKNNYLIVVFESKSEQLCKVYLNETINKITKLTFKEDMLK
jgi:hypothetical protein